MNSPKLRGLAKAYSDGLIDRKQYIVERRQLIDGIVAGELEIVPYEAPQPDPDPAIERTFSDGEATLEMPRPESEIETIPVAPVPSRRSGGTLLVVFIGALAAAYAAWHALIRVDPETLPAPTITATNVPEPPNPAAILLDGFLDENTWLPQRIEGFMLAWEQEPQAARDAVTDTPTMRRAADLITQQILEEKALFELGEQDAALRKQRRLLDLADALAIENERIARQETEWVARRDALLAARASALEPDPAPTVAGPLTTNGDNVTTVAAVAEFTAAPPPVPQADPEEQAAQEPATETDAQNSLATVAANTVSATTTTDDTAGSATPVASPVSVDNDEVNAPAPAAAASASASAGTAASIAANTTTSKKAPAKRKGCRAALAKQRRPYCRDPLGTNINGPTLAVLPAGSAEIGGRKPAEKPKYTVDIKRPFALGVFEVSNAEFTTFCKATKQTCPAQPWSDPNFPVVNVSWSLAKKYTQWLSEKSNATYRLPSESEWEYAARAGTSSPYPFGDEVLPTHARFSFRGIESTPVAANDRTVNRNKFRLYHMIGNVREWVLDAWHDNHSGAAIDGSARSGGTSSARVARGGSYSDSADQVRSASRVRIDGDRGDAQTGFRVLREVE